MIKIRGYEPTSMDEVAQYLDYEAQCNKMGQILEESYKYRRLAQKMQEAKLYSYSEEDRANLLIKEWDTIHD